MCFYSDEFQLTQNSKPFGGISNGGHFEDLLHRGLGSRLGSMVGHDNNRYRLLFFAAWFVLDNRRDRDSVLAQSSRDLPHDPGLIDSVEAKIESSLEVPRARKINPFIILSPEF